jgi:anti-anti-sigma factor
MRWWSPVLWAKWWSSSRFLRCALGGGGRGLTEGLECRIYTFVICGRDGLPTLSNMLELPLTYSFATGKNDGTTILKLNGPLTLSTIFGFQNEFRGQTPQVMIVDLSESPYMDSAGLGLLMNYYVSAESHGRKLLLAGANERIESLLEMTKVHKVLKNFPTVDAAEASL